MVAMVDLDVLSGDCTDGECTIDHEHLAPIVAQRLACDARLQVGIDRAVDDALGIGRSSKVVPRGFVVRLLAGITACASSPDAMRLADSMPNHVIH